MQCTSCDSENVSEFKGEIAIHLPGLKHLDRPPVWVFPDLLVCLNCGIAQFVVPEDELQLLTKRDAATG
jgi:hypothetical protein